MPQKSRIYFLVKDPHWTFLWWEIPRAAVEQVTARHGSIAERMTLRIYDVTHIIFDGSNAHYSFDLDVSMDTDHWYLNIWASDRNYCAEIGFKSAEGVFFPVVRSNTIYLPRDRPSDSTEETWSTITV
jgi:hypothetical protein